MPHPGRGEPIGLAFFIGCVDYEDESISREELANHKPSLPFNQLSVLEVDGEVTIAQSLSILRYAGDCTQLPTRWLRTAVTSSSQLFTTCSTRRFLPREGHGEAAAHTR
ncbi:hypothetical protein PR003_g31525 [Phytophthora rubi]|uniref:GST N-terminal domain-containing protein n=1 Tax=Phytophthora rubi TaxID=129364 RepID=A0A6A4B934_9STRA|nr:hypothetical protein PR003_g31525 [Phytophthora rubi]